MMDFLLAAFFGARRTKIPLTNGQLHNARTQWYHWCLHCWAYGLLSIVIRVGIIAIVVILWSADP
jgi:hypothetical protein